MPWQLFQHHHQPQGSGVPLLLKQPWNGRENYPTLTVAHLAGVLTSPFMKKMSTPTSQEDANMAVIGAVIAVVFLTLLSVFVLIVIYLYKNKGSYHTYEQPEADPEGSVQMEDFPYKHEKEEYFI
ncbi:small cell adhesion glycoprotein isoform X1 [Python bivittatus]|uniref:Small cell adhesion glycoprotein isoform X1 n=1 Tax=Python bivittatus TaxID=176946 RepID=A0A9F5INT3_PYTBI|nr:small cell adhesion glycoprotein isoform X1 [Python bivittatus]